MARKIKSRLDSRSARLALSVQRKPHAFTAIAPGVALGYRRTRTAGSWVARIADGKGGAWTAKVGAADDYEDADGERALDYWQAIERARRIARGEADGRAKLGTVAAALDAYEADLAARGGDAANAGRVRRCLPPALAAKPVALLNAAELRRWRDGLIDGGIKRGTAARTLRAAKAALNLAADLDPRIRDRPWRTGLAGFPEAYAPVDRVQPDPVIQRLVAEAYALDQAFGLFVHVAAETAARASQIAALTVSDLDGAALKLAMPSSRKGRRRAVSRHPVPISRGLAAGLSQAAENRAPTEPLLVRAEGGSWRPSDHLPKPFAKAAAKAGVPGETMYCLRHSAIVRALIAGVPARLVAANADTSIAMLERTYARFISAHGDDAARRGLIAL